MKAVVVTGPNELKVLEVPDLKPGPYEALVKIISCSICNGTDSSILRSTFPYVKNYPGIIGHESAGVVVEQGEKVRSFKPGDVVLRPAARYNTQNGYELHSFWGGMAEYGLVTDYKAMQADNLPCNDYNAKMNQVVPKSVGAYLGSILITWKETLSALEGLEDPAGRTVLVWGGGPVGLAFAKWAKLLGAERVVLCARRWESLFWAERMGVDALVNQSMDNVQKRIKDANGGELFDVCIDAVGSREVLLAMAELVKEGGKIGAYGIPSTKDQVSIEGIKVTSMNPDEAGVHDRVFEIMQETPLPLAESIGAIVPLEYAEDAFNIIQERRALKVILECNPDAQQRALVFQS